MSQRVHYKSDTDTIASWDATIVRNLRAQYGDKLAQFSDAKVAQAWSAFGQSDEYHEDGQPAFPAWCDMSFEELR